MFNKNLSLEPEVEFGNPTRDVTLDFEFDSYSLNSSFKLISTSKTSKRFKLQMTKSVINVAAHIMAARACFLLDSNHYYYTNEPFVKRLFFILRNSRH